MAQTPQPERKSRDGVDKDEFHQRLTNAGLTKLRFSELTGIQRRTVIRWNQITAPAWTVSWLMLYKDSTKTTKKSIAAWADFMPPQ